MTITVMTVFKNQIFQSLIESILYINIDILIYNIKYLLTNHNLQNTYFQNKTVITVIVITVILFQIIPHFPCEYDIFSLLLQHKFTIV